MKDGQKAAPEKVKKYGPGLRRSLAIGAHSSLRTEALVMLS